MSWKKQLRSSVLSAEGLSDNLEIDFDTASNVEKKYPIRVTPYFLKLAKKSGSPLVRQIVPDKRELTDSSGMDDPLAEERDSPVPNLTHRYPDRVLFLVSDQCAVHCRFCTRKRKIGHHGFLSETDLENGLVYIRDHVEIKDVLVSGGDPLMLSDDRLEWILSQLKAIPHVQFIRIGTRTPSVLPMRINNKLVKLLKRYHPIFINVHFNHPHEVTEEAKKACSLLADAGIPLGNQTVLLKGINDGPAILSDLFRQLLSIRVKPYYLHQCDLTKGTGHFRTSIEDGLKIMRFLRGHISGMAVPAYVIDLPGGGGKVPLVPKYIIGRTNGNWIFKNYLGEEYRYPSE